MSDTDAPRLTRRLPGCALPLLAGIALLFLVRLVERRWAKGLLASSILEEALKGGLFVALALALPLAGGRLPGCVDPDLLPAVCIVGFAVTENLLYLLDAPTTAVYQRLVYAYPIHLNTGLLYTTVFILARAGAQPRRPAARVGLAALAWLAALLAGTAYHFALNALALVISAAAVYAVGAVNLFVLALLLVNLHHLRLERSLRDAGL